MGMPQWDLNELMERYVSSPFTLFIAISSNASLLLTTFASSLRLDARFDNFKTQLTQALKPGHNPNDPEIKAAMSILEGVGKQLSEDDDDFEMTGDGTTTAATYQDDMVTDGDEIMVDKDEVDKYLGIGGPALDQDGNVVEGEDPDFTDAFRRLMQNAIDEFGYAPRDVCNGVFDHDEWMMKHTNQLEVLDYPELKRLVRAFRAEFNIAGASHRLVVVLPLRRDLTDSDSWKMNFKSLRIARRFVELMRREEDSRLREMCSNFYRIPDSSSMAGWIFEAFVHRIFSHGWNELDGPTPQPTHMAADPFRPSTFTASSSSAPDRSHGLVRFVARTAKRVDLTSDNLEAVTLEDNMYYTPSTANDPLFDSFTINHYGGHTLVISFFHIAISSSHSGSSAGYLIIKAIMKRVRKLLKDSNLTRQVEVAYYLVCLKREGQTTNQWEMPKGWTGNPKKVDDYRGKVFCIHVPVHNLGASCLSIQILRIF
jgi:hypothetical protein